jgi:uncharacterized protein YbaP (TraB family)
MMRRFAAVAAMLLGWATQAAAEPAIWLVQSPTAKIYLFGTMHILPRKIEWLGPRTQAAFDASGTLFEEADVGMVQPQAMAHFMSQATSPDIDLWRLLPPKSAAKFRDMLRACHLPVNIVQHFRPWYAAMMPTVCQIINEGHFTTQDGPEAIFIARAKQQGKKIDFFETADEQMALLSGAPEKVQLAELEQAIDESDDGSLDAMETSWAAGDVAEMARLVVKTRHENAELYHVVFVQRNAKFAARIAAMLRGQGTVFVAIGAGHLAGPDSVQAQLAKAGISAERF